MGRIVPIMSAVVVGLVACSPLHLEAPAPEGALECVLDLGVELGYEPVGGGTDSGFIRLERRELASMAQTITATVVQGTLRIQASGRLDDGDAVSPSGRTKDDAERILQECGDG